MAETDYERYIRTDQLLSLQKHPGELSCPDELQFQMVHQVAELWMKLVAAELTRFVSAMESDEPQQGLALLHRTAKIQRLLLSQMDLLDTMSPADYLTVRTGLGNGSGQESPGFRTLLKMPGDLVWPAFASFLERSGIDLTDLYRKPESNPLVFQLAEGLTDYDQLLQLWRQRHLMLVYRIIGAGTPSLKGKPSELLAKGMKQRFFPALWNVRDAVFAEWTAEMERNKKDTGYH